MGNSEVSSIRRLSKSSKSLSLCRLSNSFPAGFPSQLHGYITQEKYLLGKLPSEIEAKLGLPSRFLADGCRILRFKRLPMSNEVDYELTAKFPGGQAFNGAMHDPRYLPASNAVHQWCLLATCRHLTSQVNTPTCDRVSGLPALDFGGIRGAKKQEYIAVVHAGLSRDYDPMTKKFSRSHCADALVGG
jgi:hypothetical protein